MLLAIKSNFQVSAPHTIALFGRKQQNVLAPYRIVNNQDSAQHKRETRLPVVPWWWRSNLLVVSLFFSIFWNAKSFNHINTPNEFEDGKSLRLISVKFSIVNSFVKVWGHRSVASQCRAFLKIIHVVATTAALPQVTTVFSTFSVGINNNRNATNRFPYNILLGHRMSCSLPCGGRTNYACACWYYLFLQKPHIYGIFIASHLDVLYQPVPFHAQFHGIADNM